MVHLAASLMLQLLEPVSDFESVEHAVAVGPVAHFAAVELVAVAELVAGLDAVPAVVAIVVAVAAVVAIVAVVGEIGPFAVATMLHIAV